MTEMTSGFSEPPTDLESDSIGQFFAAQDQTFKKYMASDPHCHQSGTAMGVLSLLSRFGRLGETLQALSVSKKDQFFYLFYNTAISIREFCRPLFKSSFAEISLPYLLKALELLEPHPDSVLGNLKYVEWKVKLITNIAAVYESSKKWEEGLAFLNERYKRFQTQYQRFTSGPAESTEIVTNNDFVLKAQTLRFRLRAEKSFGLKEFQSSIAQNSRGQQTAAYFEAIRGEGLSSKADLLRLLVDSVVPDLSQLLEALGRMQTAIDLEKLQRAAETEDQQLELFRRLEEARKVCPSEKEIARLQQTISLDLQILLLRELLDSGLQDLFEKVYALAERRCALHSIENPFIADIKFVLSNEQAVVLPGYKVFPLDLNEPQLKFELVRLRQMAAPQTSEAEPLRVTHLGTQYTDSQHAITDHKFLYLAVRKAYEIERAVVSVSVAIVDDLKGPDAATRSKFRVTQIPIVQYIGVQASTRTAPFLYALEAQPRDPVARGRYPTDLIVLLEQKFHVRPPQGYELLQTELRQVPREFVRLKNNDYIFLAAKYVRTREFAERSIGLMRKLRNIEAKAASEPGPIDLLLAKRFDLQAMADILVVFEESSQDEQFMEQNGWVVIRAAKLVWQKYLRPFFIQIGAYHLLRFRQGLTPETSESLRAIYTPEFSALLQQSLKILLKIAEVNFSVEIVPICELSFYYSFILELHGKNREAEALLKGSIEVLSRHFESSQTSRIEGKSEPILPTTLTCSQAAIRTTVAEMRRVFLEQIESDHSSLPEVAAILAQRFTLQSPEPPVQTQSLSEEDLNLSVVFMHIHCNFARFYLLNRSKVEGQAVLPPGVAQAQADKRGTGFRSEGRAVKLASLPAEARELLASVEQNPYLTCLYATIVAQNLTDPDVRQGCMFYAREQFDLAEAEEQKQLSLAVRNFLPIFAFHARSELRPTAFLDRPFDTLTAPPSAPGLPPPVLVKKGVTSLVVFIPQVSASPEEELLLYVQPRGRDARHRRVQPLSFETISDLPFNSDCSFWLEGRKLRSPFGSALLTKPLPLAQLKVYMGRACFLLKLTPLAKQFIRSAISPLFAGPAPPEPFLGHRPAPLLTDRLNPAALPDYSQMELSLLGEGVLIEAYIESFERKVTASDNKPAGQWDLSLLRIARLAVSAAELLQLGFNWRGVEAALFHAVEQVQNICAKRSLPRFLAPFFAEILVLLARVPSSYLFHSLRKLSGYVFYQAMRVCLLYREFALAKRLAILDESLGRRAFLPSIGSGDPSAVAADNGQKAVEHFMLWSKLGLKKVFDLSLARAKDSPDPALEESLVRRRTLAIQIREGSTFAEKQLIEFCQPEELLESANLFLAARLLDAEPRPVVLEPIETALNRRDWGQSDVDRLLVLEKDLISRDLGIDLDSVERERLNALVESQPSPPETANPVGESQPPRNEVAEKRAAHYLLLGPGGNVASRPSLAQLSQFHFLAAIHAFRAVRPAIQLLFPTPQFCVTAPNHLDVYRLSRAESLGEISPRFVAYLSSKPAPLPAAVETQLQAMFDAVVRALACGVRADSPILLMAQLGFLHSALKALNLPATALTQPLFVSMAMSCVLGVGALRAAKVARTRSFAAVSADMFARGMRAAAGILAFFVHGCDAAGLLRKSMFDCIKMFLEVGDKFSGSSFIPFLLLDLEARARSLRRQPDTPALNEAVVSLRGSRPRTPPQTAAIDAVAVAVAVELDTWRSELAKSSTVPSHIQRYRGIVLRFWVFNRAQAQSQGNDGEKLALKDILHVGAWLNRKNNLEALEEYHKKYDLPSHIFACIFFSKIALLGVEGPEGRSQSKKLLKESVDTVFGKHRLLKQRFRETLHEIHREASLPREDNPLRFDPRSLHFSLLSLHLLSEIFYSSKPAKQKRCLDLACAVVELLFSTRRGFPQTPEQYADFRIQDFEHRSLFLAEEELSPQALAAALEHFAHLAGLYDLHLESHPLLAYLEFLASRLLCNPLMLYEICALRAIACARIGKIEAALCVDSCYLSSNVSHESLLLGAGSAEFLVGFATKTPPDPPAFDDALTSFDERNTPSVKVFLAGKDERLNPVLVLLRQAVKLELSVCLFRKENFERTEFLLEREKELRGLADAINELSNRVQKTRFVLAVAGAFTDRPQPLTPAVLPEALREQARLLGLPDLAGSLRDLLTPRLARERVLSMLSRTRMRLAFLLTEVFEKLNLPRETLDASLRALAVAGGSDSKRELSLFAEPDRLALTKILSESPFIEREISAHFARPSCAQFFAAKSRVAWALLRLGRHEQLRRLADAGRTETRTGRLEASFFVRTQHAAAASLFLLSRLPQAEATLEAAVKLAEGQGLVELSVAKLKCDFGELLFAKGETEKALSQFVSAFDMLAGQTKIGNFLALEEHPRQLVKVMKLITAFKAKGELLGSEGESQGESKPPFVFQEFLEEPEKIEAAMKGLGEEPKLEKKKQDKQTKKPIYKPPPFAGAIETENLKGPGPTPVQDKELEHNRTKRFFTVFEDSVEVLVRLNCRVARVYSTRLADSRPDVLKNVLEILRRCEQNHIMFRKNYYILNTQKASSFYLAGFALKCAALSFIARGGSYGQLDLRSKMVIPLLRAAKEQLILASNFMRGEPIFSEFGFGPDEIMDCIAEVNLLMAKNLRCPKFTDVPLETVRRYAALRKLFLTDSEISSALDRASEDFYKELGVLRWESAQFLLKSVEVKRARFNFGEPTGLIGPEAEVELSMIGEDAKQHFSRLKVRFAKSGEEDFRPSKPSEKGKPVAREGEKVPVLELVQLMSILEKQTRLLTCANSDSLRQLTRIHSTLARENAYASTFAVDSLEVKPNVNRQGLPFLPPGHVVVSLYKSKITEDVLGSVVLVKENELEELVFIDIRLPTEELKTLLCSLSLVRDSLDPREQHKNEALMNSEWVKSASIVSRSLNDFASMNPDMMKLVESVGVPSIELVVELLDIFQRMYCSVKNPELIVLLLKLLSITSHKQ